MRRVFIGLGLVFGLVSGALAAPVFVDGAWLEQQLSNPKVVIVDMSDDDTQYLRFHIPKAARLPYDVLVKERKPDKVKVRLDDAELTHVLGRLGITRDTHVVAYDDMGGLHAARLFWELERIGHPAVSVLDGGLVQWILDGRRVTNAPSPRLATTYARAGQGRDNEAALSNVKRAREQRTALLLDVRTEEEYVGDPKKPRTGHIPGARLWPWDLAVDFEHGFVRRDEATLRRLLDKVGATPEQPVIAYCRSGHRAAQTYLVLRALGYERVQLYANSMNEYALDPGAPLRQGKEP